MLPSFSSASVSASASLIATTYHRVDGPGRKNKVHGPVETKLTRGDFFRGLVSDVLLLTAHTCTFSQIFPESFSGPVVGLSKGG